MLKYFNEYLKESKNIDSQWYILEHNNTKIKMKNFICKRIENQICKFVMPYSNELFTHNSINGDVKNCYIVPDRIMKKLTIIKESNMEHITERLDNIIYHEIFNGDQIDYLDIGTKSGFISFLPKIKIKNLKKDDDPYNNRFRQEMKIGKLITKYSIFDINEIPKKTIEIITNVYKSITSILFKEDDFEIVDGEEIRFWYDVDNYAEERGQLGKSCMKKKTDQKRLDLYVENPDVCKMLILKNSKNKLLGRSLIWKTNKGFYMDRIYTIDDYIMYRFKGYATKMGWEQFRTDKKLKVKLREDKIYNKEGSPYMDTFKYYFKEEKQLYNFRPYGDYEIFNFHM